MGLILKRPVVVKHIVTEAFKDRTLREIDATLEQVEQNLGQLEFQGRRLIAEVEREHAARAAHMREELQRERQRQEAIRDELIAKRAQIEALELETVFTAGTYDAPVKLEIGDRFSEKMRQAEILIKDDVVIAIRE